MRSNNIFQMKQNTMMQLHFRKRMNIYKNNSQPYKTNQGIFSNKELPIH